MLDGPLPQALLSAHHQDRAPSQNMRVDMGLGTTYERFALNRAILQICEAREIRTVMEGPGDGMTGIAGINSLILGQNGVDVTLVLHDHSSALLAQSIWTYYQLQDRVHIILQTNNSALPFDNEQFDLVWNFNVLTGRSKPFSLLAEMSRISREYVFVCLPNRRNYGFGLHQLEHRISRQQWDHGDANLMRPEPWHRHFTKLGLKVLETIWLDCPWWPDIVDVRKMITHFFPFLSKKISSPANCYLWRPFDLPYFSEEQFPEVHNLMKRLFFIEDSPFLWVKRRFAHHVGVLAGKS